MNALVKKEIRLLLPSCLAVLALETMQVWLWKDPDKGLMNGCFVFFFGMIILAVNSFGREFSSGTFQSLLSQPMERGQIWRTKLRLLFWASVLIFAVYFSSCDLRLWLTLTTNQSVWYLNPTIIAGDFRSAMAGSAAALFVALSGGLWTTLLLRQITAAFWITFLTPAAVFTLIVLVMSNLFNFASDVVVYCVLYGVAGLYTVFAFWFARRLFLRAQDVAWTGGTIALPEMRSAPKMFARGAERRCWRPRGALFWKELQLHQAAFIMAGALALLHLGVLAARHLGHYQRNSSTEFILEIFWGLWLVMPLLVGAAALAEERKLGTLEGQLCLPVKERTQFAVKFCVVLLLSVLFGVAMPLLLEGSRILPNVHILPSGFHFDYESNFLQRIPINTWWSFLWHCLLIINSLSPLLLLLGMAVAIGVISFYASTLARNTLQALGPAVLGLMLTYFLILILNEPYAFGLHLPWHGNLIYLIGVPLLAVTLVTLAFRNFQRLNLGRPAWLRNALVFAAVLAFVCVATTAVYHRAWEKLTPFEPAHGAARFTRANPPTLINEWDAFSVRLPDGRIWQYKTAFYNSAANGLAQLLGDIRLTSLGDGRFLDGSNWVNVIRNDWQEQIGIKTDGSLWVSETPWRMIQIKNGVWKTIEPGKLARFGSETNWSSMISDRLGLLLVKKDGTAWYWGSKNPRIEYKDWPGQRSFTPERLGTETNWVEVFLANSQTWLRKTDGTVWAGPNGRSQMTKSLELGHWRGITETSGQCLLLGIRSDGTFRVWAKQRFLNTRGGFDWQATDFQIGKESNWVDAAGRGQKIVTLKNDGTLWVWNFYHDDRGGWNPERDERAMLAAKPDRLGIHSDWLAIADAPGGIVSLAAEGSLWFWPLESAEDLGDRSGLGFFDNGNSRFEPQLDISRKPHYLGNIFSGQH